MMDSYRRRWVKWGSSPAETQRFAVRRRPREVEPKQRCGRRGTAAAAAAAAAARARHHLGKGHSVSACGRRGTWNFLKQEGVVRAYHTLLLTILGVGDFAGLRVQLSQLQRRRVRTTPNMAACGHGQFTT